MRLPPAYCGLLFFALTLAIAFGGVRMFSDPDTAWHIAAGDLIRQLHAVPMYDSWSYAAKGEVWYNLSWLFDIGFSQLFAWGGFTALYVLTASAFAGAYVFMAHHCIRRGASIYATCLTTLLCLLVAWNSLLARPNLSSILFTVTIYHLLTRYRDAGKLKALIPIPFLMALWVNMHGGFLLALPLMGTFMAEAVLGRNRAAMRAYGTVIAFCMAATLINPYGYSVYFGAYKTLSWGYDSMYLLEWQAAKVGHDVPLTLLLLAALFTGDMQDKRIPFSDRLVAIMLLIMALGTIRHGPVAAALAMPYITLRLTHIVQASRFANTMKTQESLILHDMHKTDIKIMGLIMALCAVGLMVSPFPRDMLLKEPLGFPKKEFPAKEAAFIEQHYPHTRFMTDYNIGGWLIYLWRGRVPVFVDGRASSLYSKDTLQNYADFALDNKGMGPQAKLVARLYGFEGAVIPNNDPASADWHWNPDWKLVYQGEAAAVFIKNNTP